MTLHWWMHWFWVTLWFTVITGIPLPSKIRDTITTAAAVSTVDAATRASLISKYKSDYLTTSKYLNTESVTELFKESSSSSTTTLLSVSYDKNDDNLSVTTSAPNSYVNPLPTPSSLILLSSSSLRENNRVSKSIAGINNDAAVSASLSEAFESNNNNKEKEVKEEYDNRNINNNNNNNETVLKNNNNNNNDYRVDREANDNSRDSKNKNSPASVLKNNFEESLDGGSSSSIIIIPSKNQYNINISSSNYTNDNINSNLNNNNNNNSRTSSLSSNRSLSLIKKKDSKVTWLLTGNKTSSSSSRNEKLITTTAEEDEHRRNSSLNNNNNNDNDDDNLAVLPLQEPIPTRFKLVLNRTKFIPSTNINNDDNFNDNYNDNDKLLNKSDDVEIKGDNIEDTRLLATAASILQGVSESPRLSRARSAFPSDYQQDEQQEQRQAKMSEKNSFNNSTSSSAMDIAAVTGSCLATVVLIGTMGSLGFIMYRRRYMNPPQTLNSDKCSNPDSSGYIDDSTIRDNSEEMYSLDNDSFLNSLEAMTIQNYWTDSVKHTKL